MSIHGNDFFKHELSLIVMNLWSLHGNSCLIFNNGGFINTFIENPHEVFVVVR